MNRHSRFFLICLLGCWAFSAGAGLQAQTAKNSADSPAPGDVLSAMVATPAVSGYEGELGKQISRRLATLHPVTDNLGDVVVTMGTGAPQRLIVTPIDEPGFVVSEITAEGYLRVQRLPQFGLPPVFNELYSAQPVKIGTTDGRWIDGVVAGLSVHLQGAHLNAPKAADLENFYVDIGATSPSEVRKAGVDLLSPIAMNRRLMNLGGAEDSGASIGDRFGAAALVEVLEHIDPEKMKGTLTVAFVVQQRSGARGLQRVLTTTHADEMIYVGRLLPGGPIPETPTMHRAPRREPASGVLIAGEKTDGTLSPFASSLKQIADSNKIPVAADYSAAILPASYLALPGFPAAWAHLAIAAAWPDTPAETIAAVDLENLTAFLSHYLDSSRSAGPGRGPGAEPARGGDAGHRKLPATEVLRELTEAYGVSDRETPVLRTVERLLPEWAKPETDDSGNLILHVGTATAGSKVPSILVVAHMDEIGFTIKTIANDGRLEVEWRGGGSLSFFEGHPALVHTAKGDADAIMEMPNGWDSSDFKWPDEGPRGEAASVIRVDVGARSPAEVATFGISVGDTITIPKQYRPLIGTRANGRSFDDRVGDTALVAAVWACGAPLKDRDVTFVWSTGEEQGLVGAGKVAKRLAADGHPPDYVFAVDTFVSSDSPVESKRFGDAKLGEGFVIRAIDNSNIARPDLVARVIKLAHANNVPVQYGVTAGGNDGSAFLRYGSVDIPLGWPLRYSHSPAEVIDTRDMDSLARIVTAIAKSW
jgi:putative aminopeptidase